MSANLKVGFVFLCVSPMIVGCIFAATLHGFSLTSIWLAGVVAFVILRGAVNSTRAIIHGKPQGIVFYGALLLVLALGIGAYVFTWQSYHDAQEAARIGRELSAREAAGPSLKQGSSVAENASTVQDSGTNGQRNGEYP